MAGIAGKEVFFQGAAQAAWAPGRTWTPKRPTADKGTITYGGGPWPTSGTIHFFADSSEPNQSLRPAVGQFDADGNLTVTTFREGDGLAPGKYRISVVAYETPPSKTELTFPKNYAPVRYHSPATSGLAVTVEPGQKAVTLNLDVAKK